MGIWALRGVLLFLLLAGTGCQSTGSGVPANLAGQVERFKAFPHYKAFASTSAGAGSGWAYGYADERASAAAAADEAMQRCKAGANSASVARKCRIRFLGNRSIEDTDNLEPLVTQYQEDPAAFN